MSHTILSSQIFDSKATFLGSIRTIAQNDGQYRNEYTQGTDTGMCVEKSQKAALDMHVAYINTFSADYPNDVVVVESDASYREDVG